MRANWPLVLLLGLELAIAPATDGQQTVTDTLVPGGTLLGTILDASTNEPLPGTVVTIEPGPPGAVSATRAASFWSTGLTQVTDARGAYAFTRLPPGEYRVLVRRLGYRPAAVAVHLRGGDALQLSLGMTLRPILLEPARVTALGAPFGVATTDPATEAARRIEVELYRQREFLESDTRVLTSSDVAEAVTLGETDLFRALHRLPGVTTRDDFTAELWTRGAPWSHTRVYFDGVPLFNPLHAAGVFSGVNPDAVGAVFFHPGGRHPAIGEGAAGALDIRSRPTQGRRLGGRAELSVVSGRLALDGPLGSRGGWMIAGRRTYVDLLTDLLVDPSDRIPYAFEDVATRIDVPLGSATTVEVSGLWERDDLRGTVPELLRDSRGHWGNGVLRASLTTTIGGAVLRQTLAWSRFDAHVTRLTVGDSTSAVADTGLNIVVPVHQPTENGLAESRLSGSVTSGGSSPWTVGYTLAVRRQRYEGPPPRPYPLVVRADTLQLETRRIQGALWGERRWTIGPLTADVGLRVELPGSIGNVPAVAVAPRASARYATSPTFALSASYARIYQYTQAIAPAGPAVGPDLHVSDVWLMADDTMPALRSDVGTVGVEGWLGQSWVGTATIYGRRTSGVAVPDPTPGPVGGGPLFVEATNHAAGIELSARRVAGRITGAIAYSEGFSRMDAAGWRYPSVAERRRVLDLTGMVRIGRGWRGGAALTAATGAPFTRFLLHAAAVACDSTSICGDTLYTTSEVEQPGAGRTPAYVTLDLLGEWRHDFRSWTLGVFLQLRNALNRRNAVTYMGSRDNCVLPTGDQRPARALVCDDFDRGLPVLPLAGVSVTF